MASAVMGRSRFGTPMALTMMTTNAAGNNLPRSVGLDPGVTPSSDSAMMNTTLRRHIASVLLLLSMSLPVSALAHALTVLQPPASAVVAVDMDMPCHDRMQTSIERPCGHGADCQCLHASGSAPALSSATLMQSPERTTVHYLPRRAPPPRPGSLSAPWRPPTYA